jgi:hypothetical protein
VAKKIDMQRLTGRCMRGYSKNGLWVSLTLSIEIFQQSLFGTNESLKLDIISLRLKPLAYNMDR